MKKEIYFVDDDENVLYAIRLIMHHTQFKIKTFNDPLELLANLKPEWPGVVVTDLHMPKIDGFEVINRVKQIDSEIPVIVLTGNGDVPNVLRSMKEGAYDFLEKPLSKEYLIESAKRALESRSLKLENKVLRKRISQKSKVDYLGQSESITRLKQMLRGIASSDANVMIIGETGTGKEVTAKFIHENSERTQAPFTAINCGAIPENLMDSELFGHEAGAFTGAAKTRKGKIEETNGGTLFLDEVNSMPLSMQVKLLRVLEERVVEKLGSNKTTSVDVRIIAATQVELKSMIAEGTFREDLYYRLNVIPVSLPALRDRREDIPLLFNHFIFEFCTKYNRDLIKIDDKTLNQLMLRDWSGNVRELRNIAERFVITGFMPDEEGNTPTQETSGEGFVTSTDLSLPERVGAYEKHIIEEELKKNKGVIEETYKGLQVPRKTLYDKMKKYNIDRRAFK